MVGRYFWVSEGDYCLFELQDLRSLQAKGDQGVKATEEDQSDSQIWI